MLYSVDVVRGAFNAVINYLQGGGVCGKFPRLQLHRAQAPGRPLGEPVGVRTDGEVGGRIIWGLFCTFGDGIRNLFGVRNLNFLHISI